MPFHVSAFQISVSEARENVPNGNAAAVPGNHNSTPRPSAVGLDPRTASLAVESTPQTNAARSTAHRRGWRTFYTLGSLLGDGISARVYQAEASSGAPNSQESSFDPSFILGRCQGLAMPQCLRERARKVAIKRFHRLGSKTYQKELDALRRVGVFPHVLRLLESYEGFDGEDVLVLEYCDGLTLYDLYYREHVNGGLSERLVARFIRQLLLALEHLGSCGVDHQDVKPENMMLHDVSVQSCTGELKLGDFGWAACSPAPGGGRPKLPSTGAGSLWYAPPELNPPVKKVTMELSLAVEEQGDDLVGRSDIWSVGVVLYLLVVGHNPFNAALQQKNPESVDNEVLRLVALGQFNKKTDKWLQLPLDAREFIHSMLRVRPFNRPSASEAILHPFLTKRVQKCPDSSLFFHGATVPPADREVAWKKLDGFQRLSWISVARAVSEPELDRSVVSAALDGMTNGEVPEGCREATYLWQLARELATMPIFQWLQDRGAWADVLRMSFQYLDIDGDGLLSPPDLAAHVARPAPVPGMSMKDARYESTVISATTTAWAMACRWVQRWQDPQGMKPIITASGHEGLSLSGFREALLSSHEIDDAFPGDFEAPSSMRSRGGGIVASFGGGTPGAAEGSPFDGFTRRTGNADEEEISWTDMIHREASGV